MSNSKNLISLGVIQFSNAVLPLIIFPYVLIVVGPELYSKIALSEALMFVIFTFVLYSFEVDGVSEIVHLGNQSDGKKLSMIFSKILIIRLLILTIFTILVTLLYLLLGDIFYLLLLSWMLFPLSYILQSSYLYQALEENHILALFVFFSRFIAIIMVFYFIKDPIDANLLPLIIGCVYLIASILSFLYAVKRYKLSVKIPKMQEIKRSLYSGKEIFYGNVSVLLFRDLNVLILGFLSIGATGISAYSIAEKIIKSIQAAIRPLNQFFFPKVIRLIKNITSPNMKALIIIGRSTTLQLLALFFLTLFVFLIASYRDKFNILTEFRDFNLIYSLSVVMVISVFFGVLNFMYGTVGLNHLNCKKYYANKILVTGLFSVSMSFLLISLFEEYGAAYSFVIAEFLLFIFIFKRYFKNAS